MNLIMLRLNPINQLQFRQQQQRAVATQPGFAGQAPLHANGVGQANASQDSNRGGGIGHGSLVGRAHQPYGNASSSTNPAHNPVATQAQQNQPQFGGNAEASAQRQQQIDTAVSHIMSHEQAHANAAGPYGGGISIHFGADGMPTGGSVPVSIPPIDASNPQGNLQAYQTIRDAALAPADPSGADMSVAAKAQSLYGQAQVLMAQQAQKQQQQPPF